MKKEIDKYSYHLGAADCFCEMVRAGVKKIALSHPCDSQEERNTFLEDFDSLCKKYNVSYYIEDEPFLTDLFPISLNKDKYNVIFYSDKKDLEEYLNLKREKKDSLENNNYQSKRHDIAYRYGKLLSYSDDRIIKLIEDNKEKE